MSTFKSAYDRANKAQEAYLAVADEIEDLLATGSPEDEAKALDLEPALDEAQAKAESAVNLYQKLVAAGKSSEGAAKLFVPVSPEAAEKASQGKTMSRENFDGLVATAKAEFMKNGGKVVDKEEE